MLVINNFKFLTNHTSQKGLFIQFFRYNRINRSFNVEVVTCFRTKQEKNFQKYLHISSKNIKKSIKLTYFVFKKVKTIFIKYRTPFW